MRLQIDDDQLATCVGCGLCLPHCPTFRVTGEEALSPRGRIAAIRSVHRDDAPVTAEFVRFMETCVQCRGCEPACPSGVHYGNIQEGVRSTLALQHRITPRWQRLAFAVLPRHRLLLIGSTLLALVQRARLVPRRLGLPNLPLRRTRRLEATGDSVWLFTGCVMDAWMRDTHRSTAEVLGHLGVGFALPGSGGGCCGALHTHAGLTDSSHRLAERVMASMPGDAPLRHVTVEGVRLRFAAAHMATLGEELEPLHGHNYEVRCRVEGDLTDDRWVIDFSVLKRLAREACERLDHRFLLQERSTRVQVARDGDAWTVAHGERRYRFPASDVCALPIENTTAELLGQASGRGRRTRSTLPPTVPAAKEPARARGARGGARKTAAKKTAATGTAKRTPRGKKASSDDDSFGNR